MNENLENNQTNNKMENRPNDINSNQVEQVNQINNEQINEAQKEKEKTYFNILLLCFALSIVRFILPEEISNILLPFPFATFILAIYSLATFKNSKKIKILSIAIITIHVIFMLLSIILFISCIHAFNGCIANAQ